LYTNKAYEMKNVEKILLVRKKSTEGVMHRVLCRQS